MTGRMIPTLALVAFALVAVALVAMMPDTASAHTVSRNEQHVDVVKQWNSLYFASIIVRTYASTSEYKSENTMLTYYHTNSGVVPDGRCKFKFQFCFNGFTDPKIRYYHSGNSYDLTDFTQQTCIIGGNDFGKCFESSTNLGWLTWPINAKASIRLGLAMNKQGEIFFFKSCWCSVKTFTMNDYEVD
ncbi:MAG: hypothetical protein OXI91_16675 [Chloroflexota bacterium]|nr:hypothetical protein [Chloroflexota bacterium]